ncbi:amidohydrolase family protein [Lacrimispora sp. 210928-DFI.3.58]|uniref:amidohydrolase family protein n=1 Tax=Lacrimispora sp. 210928-DFI.3.58 TaxID=2883214 RepID=UPI001D08D1A8|nr:amidohydrolase [Lacrimispora sp. 210928-DFI.3.58]MCB7317872.1 amidohydrolase [Lacrimispora sp. 210928-DFI.3.58]
MISYLLRNGIIVTVDKERKVFYKGAIALKDDRILEVGPDKEMTEKYGEWGRVMDLEGKLVFPGFINTHNHLFQTLLRGLGDDMVLKDWLETMTFPAASNLQPEDCYHGAMLGLMEGIHSGVTTNLDYMYPHPREGLDDGVIKAMRQLGIRGIFGRGCMDTGVQFGVHPGIMQTKEEVERDIRDIFERYHNCDHGRIKVWAAPAAIWSNTRENLRMLYRITQEYGSGFTVHISETEFDREAAKSLHGKWDIDAMIDMGICGPNVLMVHCVHLTEEDIEKARKYDLKISYNPCSNMYLSSGVAPIPALLKAGVTCSLGVDGAASNNANDMLELMKNAALLQKCATRDPLSITAEKVVEMATIDGARALGLEKEIGSLEPGKKADLVVFDPYECVKAVPLHNPCSTLVYSSSLKNIVHVMVDGRFIMEDGRILTVEDEKRELRAAQQAAEELCIRGGITNRLEGHRWNSGR